MNGLLDLVFVVNFEPAAHFPHGRKHVTAHALEALQEKKRQKEKEKRNVCECKKAKINQSVKIRIADVSTLARVAQSIVLLTSMVRLHSPRFRASYSLFTADG